MSESRGLYAALKQLGATALAVVQTRLALFANELAEERLRIATLAATGVAAIVALTVGVLLGVAFLVVLFWEQRLWILGGGAFAALLAGGLFLRAAAQQARRPTALFSASLAELQTDREQLAGAAAPPPAP